MLVVGRETLLMDQESNEMFWEIVKEAGLAISKDDVERDRIKEPFENVDKENFMTQLYPYL